MSSEESSDEEVNVQTRPSTPPELRAEAELAINDLLPPKSKAKYMLAYENFMSWKRNKNAHGFSENVFLAYFKELARSKKSSTLWAVFSMIRATIQLKHNVNIKNYTKVTAWLKRQADGYTAKKSKIFTRENVITFLTQAPDDTYLAIKVALILSIKGACRAVELTNITTNNMEFQDDIVIFKLSDKKNKTERSFVIRDEFFYILKKYVSHRPENTLTDRLFLNYRDGKCTRQVIGRNNILSMPKQIANFLNLPNPHLYTGHCLRRTSITLENEDNLLVKRHGGKTEKVTDGMGEPNDKRNTINILKTENNTAKSHGDLYTKLRAGGSRDPPDFIEQHTPPKVEVDVMTFPKPPSGPSRIIYVKSIDPNAVTTNPVDPLSRRSQRCRFCFQFSEECIPISPNYLSADKTTLAFNNVEVQLDFTDNFPNVVCKDCDIKLQIMYDFVKDVKAAQDRLVNVELEIASRREDVGIEMVTVKTEYIDENDSPDEDDNDCDSPDEDDNNKNNDSEDDNEDNDTKEGILDSVTVSETNFTKKIITQKRKHTTSTENPKKAKVTEYEHTEFVMDIKEEVIERNDTTDANNAGLTDTGTTGIDVTPCTSIEEFVSASVYAMRSDGNS